jgi:hypothetical protein
VPTTSQLADHEVQHSPYAVTNDPSLILLQAKGSTQHWIDSISGTRAALEAFAETF